MPTAPTEQPCSPGARKSQPRMKSLVRPFRRLAAPRPVPPVRLSHNTAISPTVTATTVEPVTAWLDEFGSALRDGDTAGAAALFHSEDSYWRDLVSFSWNLATFEGRDEIGAALAATTPAAKPSCFTLQGEPTVADTHVEGWFTFETEVGRGKGLVRLKDGKAWTLLTTMQELKGFEEGNDANGNRPRGVVHGSHAGRLSWLEQKTLDEESLGYDADNQPYVVIIGGGQGAIALGARLKQLNVPAIIIEKNERAGDSWRKRYRSLCLHDPVWYDHLPYLPFPENWPVFSPKDKIGDWLEMYTKIFGELSHKQSPPQPDSQGGSDSHRLLVFFSELNYWSSSTVTSASFNEDTSEWSVNVSRGSHAGYPHVDKLVTLKPTHVVMATGMSGFANMPIFVGEETFNGSL